MSKPPLISIIMPVYNAAPFIEETIQSVMAQTYKNWELVIVDDGSTDGTQQAVEKLNLPTKRLQYYVLDNNRGPGAARNYGINKAKGELIAFLDGDDLWAPEKLTKQIEAMQHYKCDFVLSSGQFIGAPAGAVFGTAKGSYTGEEMFNLLYKYNRIPIVSVLTKKKLIQKADGFKETGLLSRKCEDYDLWTRLAHAGATFYGLEDKLVTYRIHANSHAGQTTTILEADLQVVQQYSDEMSQNQPKVYKARMRQLYDRLAASYSSDGKKAEAKKALRGLKEYQNVWLVAAKSVLATALGKYYGKLYQRVMY